MQNAMRSITRIAVALSLGSAWLAAPAAAQQAYRVALGTEMRVTMRDSAAVHRGTYARRAADSVVLRACGRCTPVAYAFADLTSLEHLEAHTSIRSVVGGALFGMAAGGLIGYGAAAAGDESPCVGECGAYRGVAAVMGGVVGLATGTVAGYVHGRHWRWEPIPLPAR